MIIKKKKKTPAIILKCSHGLLNYFNNLVVNISGVDVSGEYVLIYF